MILTLFQTLMAQFLIVVLFIWAALLMTNRVVSQLRTVESFFNSEYGEKLQENIEKLSHHSINDEKSKEIIMHAFAVIQNLLMDRVSSLEDSKKRSRDGMVIFIIATLSQLILTVSQQL